MPTPGSFPELGLLPPSEPYGTLNRLLKKAVKAMREGADVTHFLVPVSRTIYPGKPFCRETEACKVRSAAVSRQKDIRISCPLSEVYPSERTVAKHMRAKIISCMKLPWMQCFSWRIMTQDYVCIRWRTRHLRDNMSS